MSGSERRVKILMESMENIETAKDGKRPYNWRSYFGGPAWEKLPGHEDKYYMHLFHRKQPDLNWENPECREEIYRMINWWLDKGLAGFRIDAIINIKKALPLHDYPVDREDGLSDVHNMLHEAVGVGDFLTELRDRTFRPHDAFTVARLIDLSMPIGYFMTTENLITFRTDDYIDSIRDVMAKRRNRDFPILDHKGIFRGTISRRNLMDMSRKQVVLVDHNEPAQAVEVEASG